MNVIAVAWQVKNWYIRPVTFIHKSLLSSTLRNTVLKYIIQKTRKNSKLYMV